MHNPKTCAQVLCTRQWIATCTLYRRRTTQHHHREGRRKGARRFEKRRAWAVRLIVLRDDIMTIDGLLVGYPLCIGPCRSAVHRTRCNHLGNAARAIVECRPDKCRRPVSRPVNGAFKSGGTLAGLCLESGL